VDPGPRHRPREPAAVGSGRGPGGTAIGWFDACNADLEKAYTVVHWEPRGAGRSFPVLFTDRPGRTPQQYVADGLELTDRLRHAFGTEAVCLVGHS
jgi:pimeloyl-ACP methyl ester carboxylesterase